MVNIAVLGHGTVGSGVVELLQDNSAILKKRTGKEIGVKYILDREIPKSGRNIEKFTTDFNQIVNDKDVSVVVEVIGGIDPVYGFTKACLEAGKHVVTANKQLVAEKGAELLEIAKANGVKYLFEASVGGGIPVIRPLNQDLMPNNIESIAGILNGTSNFILTKMKKHGLPFEDILKEAQDLGYAEADPSADVDGYDTCRKICILTSIAYGEHIYPENVHTEGIRNISTEDINFAQQAGFSIKLIGNSYKADDGIHVIVAPMLVSNNTMLGGVEDVFNAVEIVGDYVGEVVFYGRGAGKLPTASAIVSDIAECVTRPEVPGPSWKDSQGNNVVNYLLNKTSMMVRYTGDFELAESIFGFGEIIKISQTKKETVFLTPFYMTEVQLDEKLRTLTLEYGEVISKIRVLGESDRWKV